jgi:small subunit ribosomal protein S8
MNRQRAEQDKIQQTMPDTLSNLFSHIQNGQKNGILTIRYRHEHTVIATLNILTDHGYIRGYRFRSDQPEGKKTPFRRKQIEILLKYRNKKAAISELVRVSKPSRRIYLSVDQLVQIANLSKDQGASGYRLRKSGSGTGEEKTNTHGKRD